jgi:hypothetical protein
MPIAVNPDTGETVYLTPEGQWAPARTAVNPQTKETLAFDGQQWAPLPAPKQEAPAAIDPYSAEARKRFDELKAKGVDPAAGLSRLAAQGMTFNAADEILAGLQTPLEMIRRRTWSPVEGYKSAKAMEDLALEEGRKNSGIAGKAAEILGGVGSGAGITGGGLTFARSLPPSAGLLARSAAAGADGLAMGAGAGLMEGNSLAERGQNALTGGLLGGAVGGAAPGAIAMGGAALSPLLSNIRARVNPQGFASNQVARAVIESGQTPQQIAGQVGQAAAEGQGMFTLADAMGNAGQRMLSTTARAPGPGRTAVVDFLEGRQAGQGRRVANTLAEGFDSPQTAAQTEARLTTQRGNEANVNYGQARHDAGAVNVTPAIEAIDQTLQPGVTRIMAPQTNIADNSIEGALRRARSYLTDGRSQVTNFDQALMAKRELDAMIDTASPTVQRTLIPVRNALDNQLAEASQSYANARNTFRQQSQAIEAVDAGRNASMRGRTEDTIPAFRAMPPDQQASYRSGYVDPLIADAQKAAFGVNKARPLTSDAFRDEAAAIAPMRTQGQMERRLGRENTMFETRAQATGGSKTADNLADQGSLRDTPSFVARLGAAGLTGNLRNVISAGTDMLSGNTPQVREAIASILLQRGQNVTPQALQRAIDEAVQRIQRAQMTARILGRGAAGGLAVAPAAIR